MLAQVPQAQKKAVALDLKVIFQAARSETAEVLGLVLRALQGVLPEGCDGVEAGTFAGADLHGVPHESPEVHPIDERSGAALPRSQRSSGVRGSLGCARTSAAPRIWQRW